MSELGSCRLNDVLNILELIKVVLLLSYFVMLWCWFLSSHDSFEHKSACIFNVLSHLLLDWDFDGVRIGSRKH